MSQVAKDKYGREISSFRPEVVETLNYPAGKGTVVWYRGDLYIVGSHCGWQRIDLSPPIDEPVTVEAAK